MAVIEESHDYHEFGMEMNGRGFSGSYRFGYQGSEKDNEVSGDGNSYTTEFRQLDPRLGRWFSVDPVFQPWQSPYTSMDNNPIRNTDVKGDKAGDKTTLEINGTTFDAIELSGDESRSLPANSWVELDGQPTTKVIYDSKNSKPLYIKKGGVFYKIVEPSKQKEQATTTESTSKPIEIKTHNKPAAKNTTDSKRKQKPKTMKTLTEKNKKKRRAIKKSLLIKLKRFMVRWELSLSREK